MLINPETIPNYKEGCTFTEVESTVVSTDFSLDGKYYVTSNENNQILWFDCLKGKRRNLINSFKYGAGLVKYTHGKTAVLHTSTKVNNDLRLLDVEQQSYFKYYSGHSAHVTSLTTSADEDIFASASEDGTIRIWDFRENHSVGKVNVYINSPVVQFDPSGLFFSVGFENETILMYDMRHYKSDKYFKRINLEKERGIFATNMEYSRDGTKLLISTTGPKIRLHDANTGLVLYNLTGMYRCLNISEQLVLISNH